MLFSVPNFSEGRDGPASSRSGGALGRGHHCSTATPTPTTTGPFSRWRASSEALQSALAPGPRTAIERSTCRPIGACIPAIGALDVCPIVWLDGGDREAACAAAGEVAARIGALGVPVFLYGELATAPDRAERAYFRNGGLAELWLRMEGGELRPDRGPELPHPTAGATLVTARPPLAAFNVELDSGDVEVAKAVAAGAAGVRGRAGRACGRSASRSPPAGPRSRPTSTTRWRSRSARGRRARPASWRRRSAPAPRGRADRAGPRGGLAGYPDDVPIRGLDPARQTIEGRLGRSLRLGRFRSAMAQTKKKRRRKHRGTQGGRIDTKRRTGRPQSREEAKARARSRRKPAAKTSMRRRPGASRSPGA